MLEDRLIFFNRFVIRGVGSVWLFVLSLTISRIMSGGYLLAVRYALISKGMCNVKIVQFAMFSVNKSFCLQMQYKHWYWVSNCADDTCVPKFKQKCSVISDVQECVLIETVPSGFLLYTRREQRTETVRDTSLSWDTSDFIELAYWITI